LNCTIVNRLKYFVVGNGNSILFDVKLLFIIKEFDVGSHHLTYFELKAIRQVLKNIFAMFSITVSSHNQFNYPPINCYNYTLINWLNICSNEIAIRCKQETQKGNKVLQLLWNVFF